MPISKKRGMSSLPGAGRKGRPGEGVGGAPRREQVCGNELRPLSLVYTSHYFVALRFPQGHVLLCTLPVVNARASCTARISKG